MKERISHKVILNAKNLLHISRGPARNGNVVDGVEYTVIVGKGCYGGAVFTFTFFDKPWNLFKRLK